MRRRRASAPETGSLSEQKPHEPTSANASTAQWFAYLAALPLIVASIVVVRSEVYGTVAANFMALYGTALIIFSGGVRWGVSLIRPGGPTTSHLISAAMPLVISLPLFLPLTLVWKFALIMALMLVLLLDDISATRRGQGAPAWYLGARLPLTMMVEIAFLVAVMCL